MGVLVVMRRACRRESDFAIPLRGIEDNQRHLDKLMKADLKTFAKHVMGGNSRFSQVKTTWQGGNQGHR